MTLPIPPTENRLAFYCDLADQLGAERISSQAASDSVRDALKTLPLSVADIDQLRRAAEDQVWYTPRRSRDLAHIACFVAAYSQADLLLAECELTLGTILNALGKFVEATRVVERAVEHFSAIQRPDRVDRCQAELAAIYVQLGQLDQAGLILARVRTRLLARNDVVLSAYYHHAEGLWHFERNRYPEATAALIQAGHEFQSCHQLGEAANTWCLLADLLRYTNLPAAQEWVDRARQLVVSPEAVLHHARCDYTLALIYESLNRYTDGLTLIQHARSVFSEQAMAYSAALCDHQTGIIHFYLDQFEEALHAFSQAQAVFTAQSLLSQATRCELNIALVYYALNRYAQALTLFAKVAKSAEAEGRSLRVATCYMNIGLCHDRLGRYDQALRFHEQAYHTLLNLGSPVLAARCQENIGDTYRHVGRYAEALVHFQTQREMLSQQGLPVDIAWCDTYLADVYTALGDHRQALAYWDQARAAYAQADMPVRVATCNRELARVLTKTQQTAQAHATLTSARTTFAQKHLPVDVALCDIAQGEIYLSQQRVTEAAAMFRSGLLLLDPGFPDEAWRAEYGLGQCALAQADRHSALDSWLHAVDRLNQIRGTLPTERLSSGFFSDRRALYEQTLQLALELELPESALSLTEAAKAQTFLNWAEVSRDEGPALNNPYWDQLLQREENIKHRILALRHQLQVVREQLDLSLWRAGGEIGPDLPDRLEELAQLSREYEDVVEQIRLQAPARTPAHSFSVQAFRSAAQQRLPARWACLSYYLINDQQLLILYLDSQLLIPILKPLTAYDRKILDHCTDSGRDIRELIYGDMPAGRHHLTHLYQLLIPPQAQALSPDDLLIISPHAQLHALPFHALQTGTEALVNRVTTVIVPSFSALEFLFGQPDSEPSIENVLALGLSNFRDRARPLPSAEVELAGLRGQFGQRLKQLWDSQATVGALNDLGRTGELAKYDVIHFATHTVLNELAPSQSSVLLHAGDLTCTDILNLKLHARLVTLASCEGALGQRYAGDEVVSLAQAFFFAGTQTVIASLWPVEDTVTAEFMQRFYYRFDRQTRSGVAQALCRAQREMAAEGYTPNQWAPFIAIGLP